MPAPAEPWGARGGGGEREQHKQRRKGHMGAEDLQGWKRLKGRGGNMIHQGR